MQELFDASHLEAQLDDRADKFINSQVTAYAGELTRLMDAMTNSCYDQPQAFLHLYHLQGGCVFEQDDHVASLSSVFKSGKAAFAKAGGLPAVINQYKQVQACA